MDPEVIRAEQETDLAPKEVGRMLRSALGQPGWFDLNRLSHGLYDHSRSRTVLEQEKKPSGHTGGQPGRADLNRLSHGLYDHSRTRTVD
jgi:hypothetical protein